MPKLVAENFWPCSLHELTQADLLSLDDYEFQRLKRYFIEREAKHTRSKKRAMAIGRALKNKRNPYMHSELPIHIKQHVKKWVYKPSKLLTALAPNREKDWKPWNRRKVEDEIEVKNFSFLDHPHETISVLKEIAARECSDIGLHAHFVDQDVSDIAPYMLLGLMRRDMIPFMSGGKMHRTITRVLHAVEADKFMGINVRAENQNDILPFKLKHFQTAEKTSTNLAQNPTTKEKTIDDLVGTIDEWLNQLKPSRKLTKQGRAWIKNMVAEILDNAERHSDIYGKGSWSVAGFMMRKMGENNTEKLVCHLAFVSLGCSISESLLAGDSKIVQEVESYCKKMEKKTRLSKGTLTTVYALQDGVSRMPNTTVAGGSGLMEIAEVANNLGNGYKQIPPQVAILSGSSCIVFKPPYLKGQTTTQKPDLRQQFFNPDNAQETAPDVKHVFDTALPLPGTLISIRFALENEAIESIIVEKEQQAAVKEVA